MPAGSPVCLYLATNAYTTATTSSQNPFTALANHFCTLPFSVPKIHIYPAREPGHDQTPTSSPATHSPTATIAASVPALLLQATKLARFIR